MDIITQGILGAAIAEAGWRRDLGRPAIMTGILFGLVPDFDVLARIGGEWASMVHHRGFTHSIFFAPLFAPLFGHLLWKLNKERGERRQWMHMIFWVLLTHPLLDVFTVYGTQLLTPVSNTRFALDGVSIIDPMYTLPLLGALLFAWAMASKPDSGRKAARIALLATTLYLGAGYAIASSTKSLASDQLASSDRPPIERIRAMPTIANILLWRIVAKDRDGNIHVGHVSRAAPTPITFATVPATTSPLKQVVMEDERAQIFYWFADEYISWRIEEGPTRTRVYMDDMRYGGMRDTTRAMWSAEATLTPDQQVEEIKRVNSRPKDIGAEFGALWRMLRHGAE